MKKAIDSPGELEIAILEVLWRRGPSTAGEVQAELGRELAYNTVLTVLRRMESKGVLNREKVSRSHVYAAVKDRRTLRRSTVRDLVARLFDGSPGELMLHLVEEERISAKELARIEKLLASRRKKG